MRYYKIIFSTNEIPFDFNLNAAFRGGFARKNFLRDIEDARSRVSLYIRKMYFMNDVVSSFETVQVERFLEIACTRALRIFQSCFMLTGLIKRAAPQREQSFQTHFMQNRIGFPSRDWCIYLYVTRKREREKDKEKRERLRGGGGGEYTGLKRAIL